MFLFRWYRCFYFAGPEDFILAARGFYFGGPRILFWRPPELQILESKKVEIENLNLEILKSGDFFIRAISGGRG